MHRIASLGDMQETNKNERHGTSHRNAPWDPDDEYKAALVDFGHLFEWIAKHTVVPVVNATWQSAAGIYHLVRRGDYEAIWEPTWEMYGGTPEEYWITTEQLRASLRKNVQTGKRRAHVYKTDSQADRFVGLT